MGAMIVDWQNDPKRGRSDRSDRTAHTGGMTKAQEWATSWDEPGSWRRPPSRTGRHRPEENGNAGIDRTTDDERVPGSDELKSLPPPEQINSTQNVKG